MPPLQTPGSAYTNRGTGGGGRFTGRIHAAPTNRPGTAGRRAKQAFAAGRPRRGQDPALQSGVYGRFSRNPRAGHTPQQRFWVRDRVWSMRRGGNHAARRNDALPPVYGLRVVYFTL